MNNEILQSYIDILSKSKNLGELRGTIKSINTEFHNADKSEKRNFSKAIGEMCVNKADGSQFQSYKIVDGLNAFLIERLKGLYNSYSVIYTKALLMDISTLLDNLSGDRQYIDLNEINKLISNPTIIKIFEKFKRTTHIFCIDKIYNDTKAVSLDTGDIVIFDTQDYISVLIKCIGNKLYDYLIVNEINVSYNKKIYTELFLAFINSYYSLKIEGCTTDEGKINSFYIELSNAL